MNTTETFRDNIGTMDKEGKRKFVFPKKPSGKFYRYRKLVSYGLLACLFTFPFLKVNGNQFLLFNVLERRFNIFGFPFWPQDFYLVVISMIIAVIFVALFTVIYGRIFCGWICPQTIFLEMVFRRIEFAIDGDRGAQMRLSRQKWDAEKIRKRSLKWLLFFLISFAIANVFLAYFIGSDALVLMIEDGPAAHPGTLVSLLLFTGIFFWIFTSFREQVCIIVCPYGRLQGVLLDDKSINVAYDFKRGERESGRSKFKKGEDRAALGKGDCINCLQCVNVCPMGIDIRNGTQLECTNCTACIDECDTIMDSVGLPKGLIRYASESEITKKEKFRFTARMKGYSVVLLILIGILSAMLFIRSNIETTILRLPGQLFTHEGTAIRNVFTYRILNKTVNDYNEIHLELLSHKGNVKVIGKSAIKLKGQQSESGTLFIEIPQSEMASDKQKITIGIFSGSELIEKETTIFLGPRTFN